MNFVKLNKFNFAKRKVEEFGWQSKNLDRENRRIGQKKEILMDPNDVRECIMWYILLQNKQRENRSSYCSNK